MVNMITRVTEEEFIIISSFSWLIPFSTESNYLKDYVFRFDVKDSNLCLIFSTRPGSITKKFIFAKSNRLHGMFGLTSDSLTFENFLDELPDEARIEILFYLDMFM